MENSFKVDMPCTHCNSTGKLQNTECVHCQGKGTVLSPEGKRLLAYLKDSIRLTEH